MLEHLWLKDGRNAPDDAYYKGLIQLAGGLGEIIRVLLQNINALGRACGMEGILPRRISCG